MSGRTLWAIIFTLVFINCFTIGFFFSKDQAVPVSSSKANQIDEEIATVGDTIITREQWLAELENRFGKETLEELINVKVVEELAKKYKLTLTDEVIDRELTMFKSMYNSFDNEQFGDEAKWRDQIRYSILLEELLTRDVQVSDEELKNFYENNQDLYRINDMFRLSHIVVETEDEAVNVLEELEGGSSFEALALERSIDEFSSNEGGEIGFVSEENEYVPEQYLEVASQLNENERSVPIKIETGFAVILLHEKLKGVSYPFEEVKDQIRRQIALEQMSGSVSVEPLWEEIGVTWFYGNKGKTQE